MKIYYTDRLPIKIIMPQNGTIIQNVYGSIIFPYLGLSISFSNPNENRPNIMINFSRTQLKYLKRILGGNIQETVYEFTATRGQNFIFKTQIKIDENFIHFNIVNVFNGNNYQSTFSIAKNDITSIYALLSILDELDDVLKSIPLDKLYLVEKNAQQNNVNANVNTTTNMNTNINPSTNTPQPTQPITQPTIQSNQANINQTSNNIVNSPNPFGNFNNNNKNGLF